MAEHPILFGGPMVRAILDGRKTQTRRVAKIQHRRGCPWAYDEKDDTGYEWVEAEPELSGHDYRRPCRCITCPYGQPGDTLWVRETWATAPNFDDTKPRDLPHGICVVFRSNEGTTGGRWRPSIHMPRWASRITLRLTDVRVERIKEISEWDAQAEGVESDGVCGSWIRPFSLLWDSINAKRGYGWDVNPWVWALTFELAR